MNAKIMAVTALIIVFLYSAGCKGPLNGDNTPDKFTWVAELLDNSSGSPISLKVDLETENDWIDLLAVISYKIKLVDLDISGSTFDGFTTFDPGAFKTGKRYIVKLKLPDKSTGIVGGTRENTPFIYFSNLREISGVNIKKLGSYAFARTVIEKIDFPVLDFIDSYAFYYCETITDITIPENMDSIKEGTFMYSGIKNADIPNSATSIEANAFYACRSLANVTIPGSVTSIGKEAFAFCYLLKGVTIPNGIISIEEGVFRNSGLTEITIPKSVEIIKDYAFSACVGLRSITIPENVKSIGDFAFSNCTGLTTISIPDKVTLIGKAIFLNCSRLVSVTIPNKVENIGASAFERCALLTSIIIPEEVTSIGNSAFLSCSALESVDFPDSLTAIGDNAFESCISLKSITIPDKVKSIGKYAFKNCTWLSDINIPGGVTIIEDYAFQDCGFERITIPDGVTAIGTGAFRDSRLESVTIPSSVTSIGDFAFYGCKNLGKVEFSADMDEDKFSYNSFPGDLCEKYSSGKSGTYTTANPGNNAVWNRR